MGRALRPASRTRANAGESRVVREPTQPMSESPSNTNSTPPIEPTDSPEPSLPGGAPAPDLGPLRSALARIRSRSAAVQLATTLLYGAAAVGGVLLASVLLLTSRHTWARSAGWALVGVYAAVVVVVAFFRTRRHATDDVLAAHKLGAAHPTRASDLVSAVELAGLTGSRLPSGNSEALARAHVVRMTREARSLDVRPAVPLRPVLPAAATLLAVLALHAGVVQRGGERVQDAWDHLLFRPLPDASLFAPEPIAGDISLTYRYPAHMSRPPDTVAGTAGDISAPKGTVVELTARADRDVAQAFAVLSDAATGETLVPLTVEGRQLSGLLLVTEPGEWRFRYAGKSGSVVAEGPSRPVLIEPDLFPEVKLIAPEAELEVDAADTVTLELEASDDYGLATVELVYSLTRSGEQVRKQLPSPRDASRRHRDSTRWDLASLSLRPGDRVTYHLEVTDNDAISGPKKGVSSSQVLKVFSAIEHNQEVLRRAEEQWERLVTGLADRLEEPPVGDTGEGVNGVWENLVTTRDRALSSAISDMKRLAVELTQDERAPPEIGRALAHVSERVDVALQQTLERRGALLRQPSASLVRPFRRALAAEIVEEEKGVLYLEDLFDRRKLLDLAELTRELQDGRQELSRLIEQHRAAPDDASRRAIQNEVARLKERMHELFRRMREMAKGIQDEHVNREAESMLDEGEDVLSQLDEVQRSLAAGDDDAALEALEKLQKQLEKMEKDFSESAGEMTDEQREVGRKLQHLASDLLDVEAEQDALRKETDSLRQKAQEAQKERLEKLKKEFVEKQRSRIEKSRDELRGIDPLITERLAQDDDMQAAFDRLGQLEQALDMGDFDEALEQAESALRHESEMRMRLGIEQDTARRVPSLSPLRETLDDAVQRTERAEKPLRAVAKDLEELLESANENLSDEDRRRLDQLSQKQESVQRRTQQLQERLDEIGEQMPLFGPQEGGLLGEAAGKMGEAGTKMGEGDPRGAGNRQSEALEKLAQLREAMRQGQGSGGEGGVPMPFGSTGEGEDGNGRGFRSEQVEIPSADKNRAPEEFRKDILDAMKDTTPERYRERVREYYEELVK